MLVETPRTDLIFKTFTRTLFALAFPSIYSLSAKLTGFTSCTQEKLVLKVLSPQQHSVSNPGNQQNCRVSLGQHGYGCFGSGVTKRTDKFTLIKHRHALGQGR